MATTTEQWRSLTNEQHLKAISELSKNYASLNAAIQTGLILNPEHKTPLAKALDGFITSYPPLIELKHKADTLSVRNEPVLITGESGTGKELIAKILHGNRAGRFVAINITAVTDSLFESELFGHTKGSFTGATNDRVGLIEAAAGGTLFIDEIGDLPMAAQVKLLRVIQNKVYRRVGSTEDSPVCCRLLFATHQDLNDLILEHKFRLDLYYRLSTFVLHCLPLRERPADAATIAINLGIQIGPQHDEFMKQCSAVNWTGNVRQLETYVKRFLVFGSIN